MVDRTLGPELKRFLTVAFALSFIAAASTPFVGGGSSPGALVAGVCVMLGPTIAAVVAWRTTGLPFGDIGWRRFPLPWLPVAMFVVPVLAWAAGATSLFLFDGTIPWSPWLTPDSQGMLRPPESLHMGSEAFPASELWARVATRSTFVFLISALALGEEVGWRGYMQPRLTERFGVSKAIVIGAVIWRPGTCPSPWPVRKTSRACPA